MFFSPTSKMYNSCTDIEPNQMLRQIQACHITDTYRVMALQVGWIGMTTLSAFHNQQLAIYSVYTALHNNQVFQIGLNGDELIRSINIRPLV